MPPHAPTAADLTSTDLAEGVDTGLGGAFYLINLMVRLDLPATLDTGWDLATGAGAWGLLDALTRALLALDRRHPTDDALWAILAVLDHRDPLDLTDLPGKHLKDPGRFALPDSWPAPAEPLPPARLTGRLIKNLSPAMVRWLSLAVPPIRHHLRDLLNLTKRDTITGALFQVPARIYATTTHLDVVMSLNDISLPVRLAGLDANPGWLPDFARVITFHYL